MTMPQINTDVRFAQPSFIGLDDRAATVVDHGAATARAWSGDVPPTLQNERVTNALIRRIAAADAGHARALRLEMLADTPMAFITTLAEAAERPHADYAGFVQKCSAGTQNAIYVAEVGGRIVGQAGGAVHPTSKHKTMLYAVYVTAEYRGDGILEELVEAVAQWSRDAGRPTLELEVVTSNARAWKAYRRLGFEPTGDPVPHPTVPVLREQVFTRPA
jgi:GNAT superfamily N-acetyltransferase